MAESRGQTLVIEQVRSSIGYSRRQREVLRSLGLRRIGMRVERPDNDAVRGAIRAVGHLIVVRDAADVAAEAKKATAPPAQAPDKPAKKTAAKKTTKKAAAKKTTKKAAAKKTTAKKATKKTAKKTAKKKSKASGGSS